MDLNIFANKLRNDLGQQPDLLPKQQTNRSYDDVEKKLPSLNLFYIKPLPSPSLNFKI